MSLPGLVNAGMFAAASAGGSGSVALTNQNISALDPSTAVASYRVNTSGIVERGRNGSYNTLEIWLLSGSAADYEIRVTETGGVGITGGSSIGSWLGLGATREWELTEGVLGSGSQTFFTAEIRLAAPPNTVLATANITLNALVF